MAASSDLDYRTSTELVGLLAARKVSAVELFERSVARIEARDKAINAVVVRDFDRARDAAKAADAALARGQRAPLLGVPMTVKESYNVLGLPTTWGLPAGKDFRPNDDALCIARLKAAGAVILGKTNVPLSLADWQSYNDIYGTTNNPWDPARTPGGSSGGSAAALAAGYVSLELGSDIGGSLRVPAHFCGVFAHKPSLGLAPSRGQTPPNVPPLPFDNDLAVIGPMARSASDLSLGLDVIAGPDEQVNAIAYRLALPQARHQSLGNFRVLIIDTHPLIPTARAVREALHRLAEGLERAGARVARTSPLLPDLKESARIYVLLLWSRLAAFWPPDLYARQQEAAKALPPDDDRPASWQTRGAVLSHRDWIAADHQRVRVREQWRTLFRAFDVVLCPPMPTPAFPHDHNPDQRTRRIDIDGKLYPYLDQILWPGVATVAGLPASAVPIGLSGAGLPIGVQIIGPYFEDRTPLRFAELIEREFGGFIPPPAFGS
jgi:amidase